MHSDFSRKGFKAFRRRYPIWKKYAPAKQNRHIAAVRLHGVPDVFIVCLVEHKSQVDFDVTFQLLKYMVGIWDMHRSRENKERKRSALKEFKYPLVIPIVYYEGTDKWTAALHWRDRVEFSELFGQFIPDFTYKLVSLHEYSAEQLLSRQEEISLVMFLNRIQTREDLDFSRLPEEQRKTLERIVEKAPEAVLKIVAEMIYHFGLKLKLPDEDIRRFVKNVEGKNMGELWANMEDIDIPKIKEELRAEAWAEAYAEAELFKQQAKAEAELFKQQTREEAKAEVEQAKQEAQLAIQNYQKKEQELQEKERQLQEKEKQLQEMLRAAQNKM